MNWYAMTVIHGLEGALEALYVFDSKAERDWFLANGPRYSHELVIPWETRPVKASEAKAHAMVDDFGDRYAFLYDGGARYVWGQDGHEEWWSRHERRMA